jgi:hypothetical protein
MSGSGARRCRHAKLWGEEKSEKALQGRPPRSLERLCLEDDATDASVRATPVKIVGDWRLE